MARQRVADHLSVALVTGERDFNRNELELLRGPLLADVGVRTKVWTVPQMGHAIPDAEVFAAVLKWLKEGAADRGRKARQWPAMRLGGSSIPSRTGQADQLFKEARLRLQKPATLYSGLMQLQGLAAQHWPDVPAAAAARKLLAEYDARPESPLGEGRPGRAAPVSGGRSPGSRSLRVEFPAAAVRKGATRRSSPGDRAVAAGSRRSARLARRQRSCAADTRVGAEVERRRWAVRNPEAAALEALRVFRLLPLSATFVIASDCTLDVPLDP